MKRSELEVGMKLAWFDGGRFDTKRGHYVHDQRPYEVEIVSTVPPPKYAALEEGWEQIKTPFRDVGKVVVKQKLGALRKVMLAHLYPNFSAEEKAWKQRLQERESKAKKVSDDLCARQVRAEALVERGIKLISPDRPSDWARDYHGYNVVVAVDAMDRLLKLAEKVAT